MNETYPPPDFDWVTARAKCSAVEMYKVLRDVARANMLTRNGMLEKSEDGDRFQFEDRPPHGFTVWDTSGQERRAMDVDLDQELIRIEVHIGNTAVEFSARLALNDKGECKFTVAGHELDQWQVLKRALEPLFFR